MLNRSPRQAGRPGSLARSAAAAVEMAIMLPILVFILIVAIDFSRLFYYDTILYNCARNGALYQCDPMGQPNSPYANWQAAALADSFGPDGTTSLFNPPLTAADFAMQNGTINGQPTVTVTGTWNFPMVTTYLGFGNVQLQRQVTMRRTINTPLD